MATEMIDTTLGIGRSTYNVCIYRCNETDGYRAEAALAGRVIEVIDVTSTREAWDGIRAKLGKRQSHCTCNQRTTGGWHICPQHGRIW